MWSCPNCESWIIASRICPNCGAWVGDDSADEQDSDHPVELAIMGDTLLSCSGRKAKVVVPAGVKELEEYSFYNDTALQEIELPEDLTMILKCAFQECTALQEIRLPDKLKRLGRAAFYGCSALRKIEIPASVKQINTETFRDCTALRVIELSEGLEIIGGSVFKGCNALEKNRDPRQCEADRVGSISGLHRPAGDRTVRGTGENWRIRIQKLQCSEKNHDPRPV